MQDVPVAYRVEWYTHDGHYRFKIYDNIAGANHAERWLIENGADRVYVIAIVEYPEPAE